MCGRPAGTFMLNAQEPALFFKTGHILTLHCFLGPQGIPVADEDITAIRDALAQLDVVFLYKRYKELTPFWCGLCGATYCNSHWILETFFDDGFFDNIMGTCPQGHRRELWD
jgi:hypothetical protein